MKLKYILGICLSASLFAGCADEDDATGYFNDITLDKTFALIPVEGGDVTVTIKATSDWQMDSIYSVTLGDKSKANYPLPVTLNADKTSGNYSWLTASQYKGTAGETTITFHADATTGGKEAEVRFSMNGKKQHLVVRQGSLEASDATCADIIAGADGKTYRVTGTCTGIYNTKYGNWYLNDGTGQITIYGTADKDGKLANNPIDSWNLEVGDVVTVQGPKTTYGSTIELVDVTVVKIVKALLKVEGSETTVGVEGGDVEVKVAYKGNGAFYNISDEAKSWISYKDVKYVAGVKTIFEQNPADTAVYSFNVLPNTGESRKGTITFSSYSGKNSTDIAYTVKQDAYILPHGLNPEDPFNVAEAISYIDGGGEDNVYVKGVVSKIVYTFSKDYGTGTFWISEDGTFHDDAALDFEAYSVYWLDNKAWTDGDGQVEVGDQVVLCGKVTKYKTTYETSSKNAYVYSLTKGDTPAQPGTLENPFDVAQAISYIDGGGTDDVYVKGVVSKIANNGLFGTEYGNATFWISDDGVFNDDPLKDFEAYRVLYLGNRKWAEGDTQIAEGDQVILHGKLTKYRTTYETSQNAAYIFSLNGKTK